MARYPYQSFIQDGNGRAIEDVTVTVYLADTTTAATIYAAKSGGSAITGSYVTTSASGCFIFYVDGDDYTEEQLFDIIPAKSGYSFDTIQDVVIRGVTGYQPVDAALTDISGLAVTDGNIIVGDGLHWVAESGATARASIDAQEETPASLALSALTPAANKLPYFTSANAGTLTDIVAAARTLLALTTAQGDIPYCSATNIFSMLPKGVAGQVLTMNLGSTLPVWGSGTFANVKNFGAVGDNITNDAAAIQAAVDSLGTSGGTVFLPKGKYYTGNSAISIINNNIQILGEGIDFDESETTDAPSLIRYTGAGNAFTVGNPTMTYYVYGTTFKDFGILGSGAGIAGICLEYNAAGPSYFSSRTLIENVSARGFTTGSGILVKFAVGTTLRRTHTLVNLNGIKITNGTTLNLDGVVSVANTAYGLLIEAGDGISIHGQSIFESNDSSGVLVYLAAALGGLSIRNSWLENNNLTVTGTHYQFYVLGSGDLRVTNLTIAECKFASGNGTGDIYIDYTDTACLAFNRAIAPTVGATVTGINNYP